MKTHSLFVPAAAAFALIALPSGAHAQDAGSMLLKSKLEVGKTYKYRTEMEMKMDSPLGGDAKTSTTMVMDMGVAVAKAPDGANKVVTTTFDRVKMQMSMAGQEMVYDSADKTKQNPLLKTAFAGISDKEFKAIYDKNNKFVKMEGDGGAAAGLGGMGISKDQVEQMLQQLTDYNFPKKPMAPGETWEHSQKTNMGQMGAMNLDMKFTYKGKTKLDGINVAEIDFTGTVGSDGGSLVAFKDSKLTGKMYFDPKIGTIRQSTVDMDMTMAVGGAQGAEMDTTTRSTQKLLSVE